MTRQIKFRAWHQEDKVMVYDLNSLKLFHGVLNPGDYILMQFTGLLDTNGKEMFEGDIVEPIYDETCPLWSRYKFPIVWEKLNSCCCGNGDGIGFNLNLNEPEKLEIIGNIYENPELIGESE